MIKYDFFELVSAGSFVKNKTAAIINKKCIHNQEKNKIPFT